MKVKKKNKTRERKKVHKFQAMSCPDSISGAIEKSFINAMHLTNSCFKKWYTKKVISGQN